MDGHRFDAITQAMATGGIQRLSQLPYEEDCSGMQYACLEPDVAGVARFGDASLSFSPLAYAPPAPAVDVSSPLPAASMFFVSSPPEWEGGLRAGACRQLFLCLVGQVEVHADDRETRCFGPGSALIVAAASGREYPCRVVGPDGAVVAVIQLDD